MQNEKHKIKKETSKCSAISEVHENFLMYWSNDCQKIKVPYAHYVEFYSSRYLSGSFPVITVPYRTHPGAKISEILKVTPGNPGPCK